MLSSPAQGKSAMLSSPGQGKSAMLFCTLGSFILLVLSPGFLSWYSRSGGAAATRQLQGWPRSHLWLLVAGLVFVARLPERALPGRFDIFFHSHQWWHVLANYSQGLRHQYLLRAFRHQRASSPRGTPLPTARTTARYILLFGAVLVTALARRLRFGAPSSPDLAGKAARPDDAVEVTTPPEGASLRE